MEKLIRKKGRVKEFEAIIVDIKSGSRSEESFKTFVGDYFGV